MPWKLPRLVCSFPPVSSAHDLKTIPKHPRRENVGSTLTRSRLAKNRYLVKKILVLTDTTSTIFSLFNTFLHTASLQYDVEAGSYPDYITLVQFFTFANDNNTTPLQNTVIDTFLKLIASTPSKLPCEHSFPLGRNQRLIWSHARDFPNNST